MATWVGTIVATKGRPDFWAVAASHGVRKGARHGRPSPDDVPAHVLIECDVGFDFLASIRLAEMLSRELSTTAIGFVVQTTSDVHEMHTFVNGVCVRRLGYDRDQGGWVIVEGAPQSWERAYFFDEGTTAEGGTWPDLLSDELSEGDATRYEEAKRLGDASPVMSLLHPSTTVPMTRVCESLGIDGGEPAGQWKKPSFWSRLFGGGR